MEENQHRIVIIDRRGNPWMGWLRTVALIAVVMGPGVALDNEAMQWLGFFIILMASAIFMARSSISASKEMTVEEAIKHLQSL